MDMAAPALARAPPAVLRGGAPVPTAGPHTGPLPWPMPAHALYFEKQRRRFCMVHAINMALGHAEISAESVVSALDELGRARAAAGLPSIVPGFYRGSCGNFSRMAVNAYLRYARRPASAALALGDGFHLYVHMLCSVEPADLTPSGLERLSHQYGCSAFTLDYKKLPNPDDGWTPGEGPRPYGHACALRKDRRGDWYWLDSEDGRPIRVAPAGTHATWRARVYHGADDRATLCTVRETPAELIGTADTPMPIDLRPLGGATTWPDPPTAPGPAPQPAAPAAPAPAALAAPATAAAADDALAGDAALAPAAPAPAPAPPVAAHTAPRAAPATAAATRPATRPGTRKGGRHATRDWSAKALSAAAVLMKRMTARPPAAPTPADAAAAGPDPTADDATRTGAAAPADPARLLAPAAPPPPAPMDSPRREREDAHTVPQVAATRSAKQRTLEQFLARPPGAPRPCAAPSPAGAGAWPAAPQGAGPTLTTLTANCRGLASALPSLCSLLEDLTARPLLCFLSETKLVPTAHANYRNALPGYRLFFSSRSPNPGSAGAGPLAAGAAIALHADLAGATGQYVETHCDRLSHHDHTDLRGHLVHLTLRPPACNPVDIVCVYAPPGDRAVQAAVTRYVDQLTLASRAARRVLLAGGDWNAALRQSDRSTLTLSPTDAWLHALCRSSHLSPLGGVPATGPRAHTFYGVTTGADGAPVVRHSSRIDDVLSNVPGLPAAAEFTTEVGGYADHRALVHTLPLAALGLSLPPPPTAATGPTRPALALPIPKAKLAETARRIDSSMGAAMAALGAAARMAKEGALAALAPPGGRPDHTHCGIAAARRAMPDMAARVGELATSFHHLAAQAVDTMFETCPTRPSPRADGRHLPRTAAGAYRAHTRRARACKILLAKAGAAIPGTAATTPEPAAAAATVRDAVGCETLSPAAADALATAAADMAANAGDALWPAHLRATLAASTAEMRQISRDLFRSREECATRKTQAALAPGGHMKPALRALWADGKGGGSLDAVRDRATGAPTADPTAILAACDEMGKRLWCGAPAVTRTGNFLPEDREPGWAYPWQLPGAPDSDFVLHTPAQAHRTAAAPLLQIMDRATFDGCVQHLPTGRQPGPDNIYADLLRCLPSSWHTTLHDIMILAWIAGHTPGVWQQSETVLIYKKDDPLVETNYRPIGLITCIGKLWTSMVTVTMSTFAECHRIFSESQEGFRPGRSTARQVRTLINALEDAALHRKSIAILYVDFTSAFSLVNQDTLLRVMYDLGFTQDMVEVVRSVYQGAATRIRVPAGCTDPIEIRRGTIQGCPLSPFLYLCYTEPLLRWLAWGGRGYRFGCLTEAENDRYQAAGLGYCDDLVSVTPLVRAVVQLQADKITLWAKASEIPAQLRKCSATGIDHSKPHPGGARKRFPEERAKLTGITLCGSPVPFLDPDSPYAYLGLLVTCTLNWAHQLAAALATLKRKGPILARSRASPEQRLTIIQLCLKTAVAYSLLAAPYSGADIDRLDRAVATIARKSAGLPTGMATAAMLRDREQAGLGVGSLAVEYAQVTARELTRALNDTGRLGLTTLRLLQAQCSALAGIHPALVGPRAWPFSTGARQVALLDLAGISLSFDGRPIVIGGPPPAHAPTGGDCARAGGPPAAGALTPLGCLQDVAIELAAEKLPATLYSAGLMTALRSLGIVRLRDLLAKEPGGIHIVDTLSLSNTYGSQVTPKHKRALNRITLLLTQRSPTGATMGWDEAMAYTPVAALPQACRRLPAHPALATAAAENATGSTTMRDACPTADPPAKRRKQTPAPCRRAQPALASCDREEVQIPDASVEAGTHNEDWVGGIWSIWRTFLEQRLQGPASPPPKSSIGTNAADLTERRAAWRTRAGALAGLAPRRWRRGALALIASDPPAAPRGLVMGMYNADAALTHIEARAAAHADIAANPRGAPVPLAAHRRATTYYLVRFADTIMCAAHIPFYTAQGYRVTSARPCRRFS